VPCYQSRIGCASATASLPSAVSSRLHAIPLHAQFLSSAENDGRVDGREFVGLGRPSRRDGRHLLQADSTQSAHVRLDLSLLRLARAQLDEDQSVPGARELVRRRADRREVLVDRVAGVGVLHCVPRDFG